MKKTLIIEIIALLFSLFVLIFVLTSCSKQQTSDGCRMLIAQAVNKSSGQILSDTTRGYNCGLIYDQPTPAPRVLNDSITVYYIVK